MWHWCWEGISNEWEKEERVAGRKAGGYRVSRHRVSNKDDMVQSIYIYHIHPHARLVLGRMPDPIPVPCREWGERV